MLKLKELRTELGLTQKNIAKNLGCNQTAVGKYERGELEPNIQTLIKLATIFGCSVDYLLGREDDFGAVVNVTSQLSKSQSELLSVFNLLPFTCL